MTKYNQFLQEMEPRTSSFATLVLINSESCCALATTRQELQAGRGKACLTPTSSEHRPRQRAQQMLY